MSCFYTNAAAVHRQIFTLGTFRPGQGSFTAIRHDRGSLGRRNNMRLLFGIVLGVLLTIGGAYIHDGGARADATTAERPMVNWDVVSVKWHGLTEGAKHQWDRVT